MLVERLGISDFGLVLSDYEVSFIGMVRTGARAIKVRFQIYLKRASGITGIVRLCTWNS